MHAIVTDTEKFQKAVSRVAGTVSKSDSNPIQSALKLWTGDNRLLITGLDTTAHQMTLAVDANIQLSGSLLIEADHFSKVVAKMGKHPLELTHESDNTLVITCGADRHSFLLFSARMDDFPMEYSLPAQLATIPGSTLFDMQKTLLAGTLNKEQDLSFATLPDENRLRGYTGDATTGLLVRCEVPLTGKVDEFSFKVPFSVWRNLPAFGDGDIGLHIGHGLVVFTKSDEHFLIRIADTEVMMDAYDFIFDKLALGYVIAETEKFRSKLGQLRVSKSTQIASMRVLAAEQKLTFQAIDTSRGQSHLQMGLADVVGQTPDLDFDSSCLDKAAQAIGSELAMFSYLYHEHDADSGVWLLKILDESNPRLKQAVVLPIQV